MPKSANQKLKLLYLMRYLLRETDESHGVTIEDMIRFLAEQGISAERKSLYDDLEALRTFGVDVDKLGGRPTRYGVLSRDFELPELKLLVDVVQASRFITEKKSMELIGNLETLAGTHGAQALHRQVFVRNRVKSMNESIYYSVDRLHEAITADRAVSFRYFHLSAKKEPVYGHEGGRYLVSPYLLCWDDENYYLIGYDHLSEGRRTYRVDRMEGLQLEAGPRLHKELLDELDPARYPGKVFGMFGGTAKKVRLRFDEGLVEAVLDRFGRDTILTPSRGKRFNVTVEVVISEQFFGWLSGFGDKAELVGPAALREEYADYLRRLLDKYQGEND